MVTPKACGISQFKHTKGQISSCVVPVHHWENVYIDKYPQLLLFQPTQDPDSRSHHTVT